MDKEMIDRVAKAMFGDPVMPNDMVRAYRGIKAMREPTEKMLVAENVHTKCYICGGHKEGYQAMIDAVIND